MAIGLYSYPKTLIPSFSFTLSHFPKSAMLGMVALKAIILKGSLQSLEINIILATKASKVAPLSSVPSKCT